MSKVELSNAEVAERLRHYCEVIHQGLTRDHEPDCLMHLAANRLAARNAELDKLRAEVEFLASDGCRDERDELRKVVERVAKVRQQYAKWEPTAFHASLARAFVADLDASLASVQKEAPVECEHEWHLGEPGELICVKCPASKPQRPAATEAPGNDAFNIKRSCEVIVDFFGPVLVQTMLDKYLMPTILFAPLKEILAAASAHGKE